MCKEYVRLSFAAIVKERWNNYMHLLIVINRDDYVQNLGGYVLLKLYSRRTGH